MDGLEEHGGSNGVNTTANRSRFSDHSAALAEKLLQGWALLQEHCPQCLTPLVRNRQRKMYCVACAQWVVSQTEAAERLLRERVEEADRTSEPTHHPQPLPEPVSVVAISNPANIGESNRPEQNIDAVSNPLEPNCPSIRAFQDSAKNLEVPQPSNIGDSHSALVIPKLNYCPKTLEQVLPNISYILVHKLEEIGSAISRSQDVNDIRVLMSALRECLQAIADLKAM